MPDTIITNYFLSPRNIPITKGRAIKIFLELTTTRMKLIAAHLNVIHPHAIFLNP